MGFEMTCPCGETIKGETKDDLMANGKQHGEDAGHDEPTEEQMEQINASIKEV